MKSLIHEDAWSTVHRDWNFAIKKVNHWKFQLGRFLTPEELITREAYALEKLRDITGVQSLVEYCSVKRVLVTNFVEGIPLSQITCRSRYKEQVTIILEQLKKRGIIKILGWSQDLIVQKKWKIVLIDFWSCLFENDGIIRNFLWNKWTNLKVNLIMQDKTRHRD